MEGVNNVQARPSYHATKKSTAVGAGIGAFGAASALAGNFVGKKIIAGAGDFTAKKDALKVMRDAFVSAGKDLSHTTVSKLTSSLSKKTAVKSLIGWTLLGGAVGLGIDMYKNHKAKKAEKAENV